MGFFGNVLKKVFGSANERFVKHAWATVVPAINALAPDLEKLTDAQLRDKTVEFRKRLKDGATLDELMPEAFAAVREAGRRFLNMRHYDVQLIGGLVLHQGKIAEMVTGEGKTLVATLPAYLNALTGKGVHVVTVNDYLAQRDCDWMAPIYRGLGLTVGAIQSSMSSRERQPHYHSDITYGTNNEFGFDYLRDNMKSTLEQQVQGPHHYAIVDEVDSILIDEARTPLIISGSSKDDAEKYREADRVVRALGKPDPRTLENEFFKVEEKDHRVDLTEKGQSRISELLGIDNIWSGAHMEWPHLMNNALKAHHLYHREKEYDIKDGQVKIVDEFTGRIMEGRRWSDGLHQAIEAKEEREGRSVKIREEQQTLATITLQNYFKLYGKLAGMTGTAMTEASEFYKIYKLECVEIPTNRPLIREAHNDLIFGTDPEKYEAMANEIQAISTLGRPVLLGTTSIERSALMSDLLQKRGFGLEQLPKAEGDRKRHYVLNARVSYENQYLEADIVAQAGRRLVKETVGDDLEELGANAKRDSVPALLEQISALGQKHSASPGMVIIATNMAGRGTDILLGGNPAHFFYNYLRGEQGRLDHAREQEQKKKDKDKSAEDKPATDLFSDLHGILGKADALPYPMKDPAELRNPKERDGVCRALAESFQGAVSLTDSWFDGVKAEDGKQLLDGLLDPAIYTQFFDDVTWPDRLSEFFGRRIHPDSGRAVARRFIVDLIRLSLPVDEYIDRHLQVRRARLEKEQGKDADRSWLDALESEPWKGYLRKAETYARDCMFNRLLVVCPQFFNLDGLGLRDTRPGDEQSKVNYWFQAHQIGGLAIVGTERHESRRIDNQLRGRCGRQGDPGSSQFFLSLDDDLMRIFAGPRVKKVLQFAGLRHGQPIQATMVTKSVERAQKRVEQRNFDIRKNLLEYDEVMDRQRKTIYTLRQGVLEGLTEETNPLRFRTLRVKRTALERLPKSDGKLGYDDWNNWWEHEHADPTPLEEGDEWIPLEPELRKQHLYRVSWRMLSNRISRQIDDYSHPDYPAAEWDLDGFVEWFNKEFSNEVNEIAVDDVANLSLGDIRGRLTERVLWDKDPSIEEIQKDAKGRKKNELMDFAHQFAEKYGLTIDEDDHAHIESLPPKNAPDYFLNLYKDRCARRREGQIGRGRIPELERKLEEFTSGWDLHGLCRWLSKTLRVQIEPKDLVGQSRDEAEDTILERVEKTYREREKNLGEHMMRFVEQYVALDTIDNRWKDHLKEMDYLRSAVAFSGMAQKDPKVEYKIRGLDNFQQMLTLVEDNFADKLMRVRLVEEDSLEELGNIWGKGEARKDAARSSLSGAGAPGGGGGGGEGDTRGQFDQAAEQDQSGGGAVETIKREHRKIKPNEPCPCGSGKKYKKCHGLPGAPPLPAEALKKL